MKKILVVEDSEFVRKSIMRILSFEDFESMEAENGKRGVEMAQKILPDLIICDILMPEFDGYKVLEELKKDPNTSDIPFIFLTGKDSREDWRQGMEVGADDYLTKPFSSHELLNTIKTQLGKREVIAKKNEIKMNELRGNIIHALPHELRTPLASIIGFSKLLMDDHKGLAEKEIGEYAASIHKAGERLSRIMENFLLYAQVEILSTDTKKNKEFPDVKNRIDPETIFMYIEPMAMKYKRKKDVKIDIKSAALSIEVENFQKIIHELVDNAFKFSKKGTPVRIRGALSEGIYKLSVKDQGRGMRPDEIKKIGAFGQFERKLHEQQGSGFGLIIAKRLAEFHGGSLNIQSEPKKHTTVTVTLNGAPLS